MKKTILYSIIALLISLCLYIVYSRNNKAKPVVKKTVIKSVSPIKKLDTILIVTMNFNENYLLETIGKKVTDFYHIPVKYQESYLPQFAYNAERNRFRADSLISYLKHINNGRYKFVAGLTSKDISCTNGDNPDWGVFGLGSLDCSGCITSTFRLKKGVTVQKLTDRLEKVVLHEIGHNNGLQHCTTSYPCFMKAADGTISEVDSEPMDICKPCKTKLNR
jgi:archaemetzincin